MGAARVVTVDTFKTSVNLELRNVYQVQYTESEIIAYLNKWCEFIHQYLISIKSELIPKQTGTIIIVDGTELYSLSANDMGDFIVHDFVRVDNGQPLEQCGYDDRFNYIGESLYQGKPEKFYIDDNNIGLLPVPDGAYTVSIRYYPDYQSLSKTDALPFHNMFNLQLMEGVKVIAKNRESDPSSVDVSLMEIFRERINDIRLLRKPFQSSLHPVY